MNIHVDDLILYLSEKDFQEKVIALAHDLGWRVVHFRPARTLTGWKTPVAADGKGWVDLELVRERIIHAEVKKEKGKLKPDQVKWVADLSRANAEVYIWRPSMWKEIVSILTRTTRP